MNLAVNHLPVLTWNRSKLNEAELKVSDSLLSEDIKTKEALLPVKLPEGITRRSGVDADALRAEFDGLGISNPPEAVVAGKVPIYNKQKFATGMGADIDVLMENAAADIFTVSEDCRETKPVKLHYEYAAGQSGLSRIFIHARAGSESCFLLYYSARPKDSDYLKECGRCSESRFTQQSGNAQGQGLVGAQTYICLEEGAKVHFHVVQMLERDTLFFHDIGVYSRKASSLVMTKLDLGAKEVYEGLNDLQAGEKSRFEMDFGYLGLPGSKMDINYNDVFLGKGSEGRMYFKEALLKDAQKTFRGTLDFRQYSTGAKGDEQEDIILLGEDIVNKTIPLILCEEEDVDGRHAATIGSLSDEMLFYIQTRGISKRKAEELMVRAALQHISNMVPSESIKKAVLNDICRIFE